MSLLDRLAEAHIEAAVERGVFDNLPGAGKPLLLDDDAHVPPSLRAGYRLLKNAGFVPPEVERAREIREVRDLLAVAEPRGAEAEVARRRLRWLETALASSRHGRSLLQDPRYGAVVRRRLSRA